MRPRFQADADLRHAIVTAAIREEPAIEFQSANEAGLEGMPDPEVLALAADEGRILVTADAKTMPLHFGDFIAQRESPGVLIAPQHLPIYVAVEDLLAIWSASDASEWINRICRLPL